MDNNPARNKKLAKQMATQEAEKPSVQPLPAGTRLTSSVLTTLSTSFYAAADSTNALLQYWSSPPTFHAAPHAPDPAKAQIQLQSAYMSDMWRIGVSAYVTINGTLYTQTEMVDRAMWEQSDDFKAYAVRSLKRRLVEQIIEQLPVEVYVDGSAWPEPGKKV